MTSTIMRSQFLQEVNSRAKEKRKIVNRIKNYKISNNLPILDFKRGPLDNGYLYYKQAFSVKDITNNCTDEGNNLTILKVLATDNIELDSHDHITQSQTIYVNKGTIVDLSTGLAFTKGQSFFNPKQKKHTLKYLKGTMATIVFLPNLETIN